MLTSTNKVNTLWKKSKGWGSTHPEREVFEELYRSYDNISTNSVLTYGYLIPRKAGDMFFEAVRALDATNDIVEYQESSFKKVPVIKKHTDLLLTKVSSNCDHAFAILDEDGNQIKNIIPYDFSDTGIYNIVLKTQDGVEIAWGSCDWMVDTNSSLLTFSNGVPEGISANHPPKLTFYQYIGPVGERHYVDATLFDIENVTFDLLDPVKDFTDLTSDFLESIEPGFFSTYKFGGTDLTQGIGLQYNILSNITDSETNDPIKGYDDNSNAQVVSLLSHKAGESSELEVKFVSEGIPNGIHQITVEPGEKADISKINTDDGFFVVKGEPGTYSIKVTDSENITAVLLVKDNQTLDYELFYPRNVMKATIKLPVFVDLMKFPPHLKLTTLNSYSDHITPQYYGPRVVDFVIADNDATVGSRSADFVVYNREGFYLQDAIEASEGTHLYLRNGIYKNARALDLTRKFTITGETKQSTVLADIELNINKETFIENISFRNCAITVNKATVFKNCEFDETTTINVVDDSGLTIFKDCNFEAIAIAGKAQIFDSRLSTATVTGEASFFNSSIIDTLQSSGTKIELYGSYVKNFNNTDSLFYINSSRIKTFDAETADAKSIVNTTNIDFVEYIPEEIKIDSSYVVQYSDRIARRNYPDENTIPYYIGFQKRIYTKLPDPFTFDEESNEIRLKLDSVHHTIFINENGELQTRFFSSSEISLDHPENYETQIEAIYGEHADTKLSTTKPTSLEEALIDLYWSKADLKNGKVKIEQLPDSIAYGGLSFVGVWSFEDHDGAYPTFADVDFSAMSDEVYSELQRGWFFIVAASHKEDDPCYPQTAIDDETYTAGDWVVYSGKKKALTVENLQSRALLNCEVVSKDKNTLLQYASGSNGIDCTDDRYNHEHTSHTTVWSSCQQYQDRNKALNDLSSLIFFADKVDLYRSEGDFHFVESFPVEYIEGIYSNVNPKVEAYTTVKQIKIGDYKFNVLGTAVRGDNTAYSNLETQFLTKEDYENGNTRTVGRLILEAADDASKAWANETFEAVDGKFALRPTMIGGWYEDEACSNDQPLDKWDEMWNYRTPEGNIDWGTYSVEFEEKWEKVDRAYQDPVYSRLPEFATKTGAENPAWSILDGGTGLLRLSYVSLAEALRMINEVLFKLTPDRSASIQEITVVVDEENSTATKREYLEVSNGLQLNQLTQLKPSTVWDASKGGKVYFKQQGIHDQLPLEHTFYCGEESSIKVLDNGREITEQCNIDRFDPYERYRLGFRAPTEMDAAEVTGYVKLGEGAYKLDHEIKYTQYALTKSVHVTDPESSLEGETGVANFSERKFYDFSERIIHQCERDTVNLRVLNSLLTEHRTGGYGFIPGGTAVSGTFVISNFTKYGTISPDAKVELKAAFGDIPLDVEILSQYFTLVSAEEEIYDLVVGFTLNLPESNYMKDTLIVKAFAQNFGVEAPWSNVLVLKDLLLMDPTRIPTIVESAGNVLYPTLGTNIDNQFGAEYTAKKYNRVCGFPEVVFTGEGYGWPKEVEYTNTIDTLDDRIVVPTDMTGLSYDEGTYRFVTFKYELDKIHDMCGFNLHLDWVNKKPEIKMQDGTLKDVLVQICVNSAELPSTVLLDGNAPVPVFFEASIQQAEACNYPGKSDESVRRITFGRKPIPVKTIYVRIGLEKNSDLIIRGIDITED